MSLLRHVASGLAALALGFAALLPSLSLPSRVAADHCGGFHNGSGTFTTSTSTTESSHPINAPAPGGTVEQFRTRIVAVIGTSTVFDETVTGSPNSNAAQDAVTRARAAITAQLGANAAISGPEQTQTTRTQVTGEPTTSVHVEVSLSTSTVFGPATIAVGPDQSIICFIPAGTTNVNTNTHSAIFTTITPPVPTFLNFVQLTLTGSAPALQPIPQAQQNPGAIAAVMGGIGNGTRNNTPVPARPLATAPQAQNVASMPVLRPPSTGDAGLAALRSES